AGVTLREVDAVAATVGPGLIGCLLVGANYARGLALAAGLPFIGVNHLEGHVYANWLYPGAGASEGARAAEDATPEPEIPAVVLVVSGTHSDLVLMEAHRRFRLLGRTIDDAAGEAFDKVARLLGLGFPGGPEIEKAAKDGDPNAYPLPKAWLADRYDFSFSGLKTAVLRLVKSLEEKGPVPVGDVAASFQKAIVEALAEKTARAAAARGEPVPEAVTDLVLRILSEASDTPAVLDALKGAPDGRALLRIIDGARAIEFRAGDGTLFAEAAEPKGKGPKVDATAATWLV